ncbi:hypothetical protein [Dehalobacter sp. 14DCB1]|uniref:hypothetical protein n=1 Tax=Dehalobacter sp. 14DCB1 TaxID=2070227 RepID=UPI001050C39E|nr:hypothetical protein [Dehalobacter sp. 14DCB1]TCX53792.1 hypothetical protein C1I36_03415 [Dehalobacter sp. 14DCB1]
MNITVDVSTYRAKLGKNDSDFELLRSSLPQIINNELIDFFGQKVEMYNLCHDKFTIDSLDEQKLLIYINTAAKCAGNDVKFDTPIHINGKEYPFTNFMSQSFTEGKIAIMSDEGIIIAEFVPAYNELYVLFDPFANDAQEGIAIFTYIMREFQVKVLKPKTFENSWLHTQNKSALTARFSDVLKKKKEENLHQDIKNVERYENDIQNYKQTIKNTIDALNQTRRRIVAEQNNTSDVLEKIIKDFDLIAAHKKVKDLQIKNNEITIYTKPLYIYADNGKRYYGGSYRIVLKPEEADIRFFGDNQRHSCWTDHDPHPHVNGSSGRACLGNTETTIAELSSQMQIYALALIGIDFLEAANTKDPAGENVRNWDEVDVEGNIIQYGNGSESYEEDEEDERTEYCDCCDDYFREGETHPVYGRVATETDDEGNESYYADDEHWVCETCRAEYYHIDEHVHEYIHN